MRLCRPTRPFSLKRKSEPTGLGQQRNPKPKPTAKIKSKSEDIHASSLGGPRVYQWAGLLRLKSVAKKPADRSRGFRGRSSTGKEPPVCGIPRPLDRAGSFLPFSSHRKPSSHWYTMPPKERVSLPVNLGFVAAARQFNSFLFRTPKPLVPIG